MQKNIKAVLFILNNLFLAFLLVMLVIETLTPIEIMEAQFFETLHTNWIWSPIVCRIWLGLIFMTAVSVLVGINKKISAFLLILVIISVFVDLAFLQKEGVIFIGFYRYPSFIVEAGFLALLAFFTSLHYYLFTEFKFIKKYAFIKFLPFILIVLPFILNPVYPCDFKADYSIDPEGSAQFDKLKANFPAYTANDTNTVYAFFSVTCPYCKLAARKLYVSQARYPNFPKVKVVFWGEEESIQHYMKITDTHFPYLKIEDASFPDYAGGSYPRFKYVKNNTLAASWIGNGLNFGVFDDLSKLKNK